jgi:hypothetical protein
LFVGFNAIREKLFRHFADSFLKNDIEQHQTPFRENKKLGFTANKVKSSFFEL